MEFVFSLYGLGPPECSISELGLTFENMNIKYNV
jgi:hypothetical protein